MLAAAYFFRQDIGPPSPVLFLAQGGIQHAENDQRPAGQVTHGHMLMQEQDAQHHGGEGLHRIEEGTGAGLHPGQAVIPHNEAARRVMLEKCSEMG